jgi:hypothetical protein
MNKINISNVLYGVLVIITIPFFIIIAFLWNVFYKVPKEIIEDVKSLF